MKDNEQDRKDAVVLMLKSFWATQSKWERWRMHVESVIILYYRYLYRYLFSPSSIRDLAGGLILCLCELAATYFHRLLQESDSFFCSSNDTSMIVKIDKWHRTNLEKKVTDSRWLSVVMYSEVVRNRDRTSNDHLWLATTLLYLGVLRSSLAS